MKILPISVTMMLAAVLGPRLATRWSPRTVVQIGLGFLFVSILGLMLSISPNLASAPFALSMAGFGTGVGLVISQLGNVVMSSVEDPRASEAGGVQGAAQNLGQSIGTALIGAVLLTGPDCPLRRSRLSWPTTTLLRSRRSSELCWRRRYSSWWAYGSRGRFQATRFREETRFGGSPEADEVAGHAGIESVDLTPTA